jgi:hypothetical protein
MTATWTPGELRQIDGAPRRYEPGDQHAEPLVSVPARSVTGWPGQVVSAAPAMAGQGRHNHEVKIAQDTAGPGDLAGPGDAAGPGVAVST